MMALLRRAVPDDAPRLALLARWVWLDSYADGGVQMAYVNHFDDALTADAFRASLLDPQQALWVMEEGAALQGFAQLRRQVPSPAADGGEPGTELERLYVSPRCTGRGLGKQLLAAARQTWPGEGLWLSVWAGNERARRFYRREGGQVVGETEFLLDGQAHRNLVFAWGAL